MNGIPYRAGNRCGWDWDPWEQGTLTHSLLRNPWPFHIATEELCTPQVHSNILNLRQVPAPKRATRIIYIWRTIWFLDLWYCQTVWPVGFGMLPSSALQGEERTARGKGEGERSDGGGRVGEAANFLVRRTWDALHGIEAERTRLELLSFGSVWGWEQRSPECFAVIAAMATTMWLDLKDSVMAMLPDVPLTDAVIFGFHIHGERAFSLLLCLAVIRFGVLCRRSCTLFCSEFFLFSFFSVFFSLTPGRCHEVIVLC